MTASRACNYLQNAAATTYKKFLQFYAKRSCKKHNKIKDLRQNDRPVQAEEFNSCMQEANLEYKMVSEKKGVYIIRR